MEKSIITKKSVKLNLEMKKAQKEARKYYRTSLFEKKKMKRRQLSEKVFI